MVRGAIFTGSLIGISIGAPMILGPEWGVPITVFSIAGLLIFGITSGTFRRLHADWRLVRVNGGPGREGEVSEVDQRGWVCPKCGAVMAPFMVECVNNKTHIQGTAVTADGTAGMRRGVK